MTGLLYLIVIVMWAAVLFPIFLKKHDQDRLHKSVGLKPNVTKLRWQPRVAPTKRQQAFIRRRRVLMTLLTAIVLFVLAGLSGTFSILWTLVPVTLLTVFVSLAIKNGAKLTALPDQPIPTEIPLAPVARQAQTTIALPLPVEAIEEQAKPKTWKPVEPPMPSYVRAERATSVPRGIDAQRPWTGQDMVEHANNLRKEHQQRINDAKKRLEEARAISMEKARKAALSAMPIVAENASDNDSAQAVNE
ncbi:MAG: hypothetical protein KGQ38_05305 [Actinomycetales bacterium]|nr:hypothetical protein [Actinomycetales bacterium]